MPGSIRVSVLEAFDLLGTVADGKDVAIKGFWSLIVGRDCWVPEGRRTFGQAVAHEQWTLSNDYTCFSMPSRGLNLACNAVSLGKTEYKTEPSPAVGGKTTPWNSVFEFPVLNLRDNLLVMLIGDDEAISKNEIDTPSIVEQGSFSVDLVLKGGGKIHLSLIFVLTDEERRRIDMMRAAALKRKEEAALKASASLPPAGHNEIPFDGTQESSVKAIRNAGLEGSGLQASNQQPLALEKLDRPEKSLDRWVDERRQGSLASEDLEVPEKSLNLSVNERGEVAISPRNDEGQGELSTLSSMSGGQPVSETHISKTKEPTSDHKVQTAFDQGSVGDGLLAHKEQTEGSAKESPNPAAGCADATPSSVKAKIKAFENTKPKGVNVQLATVSGKLQMSSPYSKVSSTKMAKNDADDEAEGFGAAPSQRKEELPLEPANHMVELERTHAISVDTELPIDERGHARQWTRWKEDGQSLLERENSSLAGAKKPLESSVPSQNVNNVGNLDGDRSVPSQDVNNVGNLDGDRRVVTEQPADVELNAKSMKEKTNSNLHGISQQVLGGMAVVAAGVLLWAAHSWSAHSSKRSSYRKKSKQRKRK